MRGCFRHAYPQSAGYGWDPAGMARLHFVGTIENFVDDWQALLARLEPGAPPRATPPQDLRTVNRRSKELPAALQPGGGERAALERHPAVVRHHRGLTPGGRGTPRCARLVDGVATGVVPAAEGEVFGAARVVLDGPKCKNVYPFRNLRGAQPFSLPGRELAGGRNRHFTFTPVD